jgi:hypothetical protein
MNFIKDDFEFHGGYLNYRGDCGAFNQYYTLPCHPSRLGTRRVRFVARFKYHAADRHTFITFLIRNFTVEEYFGRIDNGEAPLTILESKGYVLPRVKKELKKRGYPTTQAGFRRMIADRVEEARRSNAA